MNAFLELKNISVNYGMVKALDGVSLHFNSGEIVALMGPNGAGKSTILKVIFGLATVANGEIFWEGKKIKPITYEMVNRSIAYVPQGRRVFRDLNVRENLEIGGYAVKNKTLLKKRIAGVLKLFPALKSKLNEPSRALSGGQQQMLAIARGLMIEPKLLLLDEPSLGISPKVVKEVFAKIEEINKKLKTTVVVVEHNIRSSAKIADRVCVLDKGKLIAEGKPKELLASGILEKIFLGIA